MTKNQFFLAILIFIASSCKIPPQKATQNLYSAVLLNDVANVKKYIQKGANVNTQENQRGWTPLLFASEAGYFDIAKILVENGADVNIASSKNKTAPLNRAASNGYINIVRLLVENGADIDYQDAKLKSTPLMRASANGHKKVVEILLNNDALINVRGHRGESALFLAVSAEHVDVVKLLLSHGAITDRVDIYGKTPLQKAKELNNQELINLLNNN